MADRHLSDPLDFLYGELPPEAMKAARRHLAKCGVCREDVRAAREIVDAYRAAPRPAPPPGLAARAASMAVRRAREEQAASPSAALAELYAGRALTSQEEQACRQAIRTVMEEEFGRLRDEVLAEAPAGWRTWFFHPGWAIAASVFFIFSILILHSGRGTGRLSDSAVQGGAPSREAGRRIAARAEREEALSRREEVSPPAVREEAASPSRDLPGATATEPRAMAFSHLKDGKAANVTAPAAPALPASSAPASDGGGGEAAVSLRPPPASAEAAPVADAFPVTEGESAMDRTARQARTAAAAAVSSSSLGSFPPEYGAATGGTAASPAVRHVPSVPAAPTPAPDSPAISASPATSPVDQPPLAEAETALSFTETSGSTEGAFPPSPVRPDEVLPVPAEPPAGVGDAVAATVEPVPAPTTRPVVESEPLSPSSPLPPELLSRRQSPEDEPAVVFEWQGLVEPPQLVERPVPVNVSERVQSLITLAGMAMASGDFDEAREAVELLRRYDEEAAARLDGVLMAVEGSAAKKVDGQVPDGAAPGELLEHREQSGEAPSDPPPSREEDRWADTVFPGQVPSPEEAVLPSVETGIGNEPAALEEPGSPVERSGAGPEPVTTPILPGAEEVAVEPPVGAWAVPGEGVPDRETATGIDPDAGSIPAPAPGQTARGASPATRSGTENAGREKRKKKPFSTDPYIRGY